MNRDRFEFKICKISKIKEDQKNEQEEVNEDPKQFCNKEIIIEHVMDHFEKENFSQQQRRKNDNIQLIPKRSI